MPIVKGITSISLSIKLLVAVSLTFTVAKKITHAKENEEERKGEKRGPCAYGQAGSNP